MNRVLRVVITWLLLLAVPLQGYAAASMLFCGANAAPSGVVEQDHQHAQPYAGAGMHHHAAATTVGDDSDRPGLHQLMHDKCSVCTSCCSPAALPAATIASAVALPSLAPSLPSERADPGHGPARLERPPRLLLA